MLAFEDVLKLVALSGTPVSSVPIRPGVSSTQAGEPAATLP
jgi:hypothetical protein